MLIDIVEGLPQGKALDLAEAAPVVGHDMKITGTNDYADTAGSDIVVVTSGLARQPGMSRDDLLSKNAGIVRSVVQQADQPLAGRDPDHRHQSARRHVPRRAGGERLPPERVIGMAGVLDSARFRTFIAQELGVSVTQHARLRAGRPRRHDGAAAALLDAGGVPITELIEAERIEAIVDRTRNGGAEIVALLKTGSAYYAPAASVAQMVDSILNDRNEILPCAATCRASTASTGCSWACRSSWAARVSPRSSRSS